MLVCETCGVAVHRNEMDTNKLSADSLEMAGKVFYGLSPQSALCPSCLENVRDTGSAVWDAEYATFCPLCRKRVERAWDRAEATALPTGELVHDMGNPLPPTVGHHPVRARHR